MTRAVVRARRVALWVSLGALGALCALGCGQEVRHYDRGLYQLDHIVLSIANVWVLNVQDGGTMMFDAGAKGDGPHILDGLEEAGIATNEIDLIALSHGHLDHAGAAAFLQDELSAPIGVHEDDLKMVEDGNSPVPEAQNLEGAIARPFLDPTFPPFTPDVTFGANQRLDLYGIPGEVLHLPGHTPGTIAIVMDNGDAYVGDIVRGTDEGAHGDDEGNCNTHLFSEDFPADRESMEALLARGATTFFPGHGPYFAKDSVRGWLEDTQEDSDRREHKSKDLAVR